MGPVGFYCVPDTRNCIIHESSIWSVSTEWKGYVVHHLYWQQEAKLLICNLRERLQTMGKKRPLTACDKRRSEKITSTCFTQLTNVEKHKRNIIFPIFFFKISALWTISFGVIPNPTSLFPSLPFCLPPLNFFNDFIAVLFSRFFPTFFYCRWPVTKTFWLTHRNFQKPICFNCFSQYFSAFLLPLDNACICCINLYHVSFHFFHLQIIGVEVATLQVAYAYILLALHRLLYYSQL